MTGWSHIAPPDKASPLPHTHAPATAGFFVAVRQMTIRPLERQRMTPHDKFASDLEAILETIKTQRMDLMNGSYPQETRKLVYERLRYLANEAKSLLTEMDRIDETAGASPEVDKGNAS